MITQEQIHESAGTGDFIPLLRQEFQDGEYASVIVAINDYIQHATDNRPAVQGRLYHILKPFVHNYVVGATIRVGSVTRWESEFPSLIQARGLARMAWDEYVDQEAKKGPAEFAAAVQVIRETCQEIEKQATTPGAAPEPA